MKSKKKVCLDCGNLSYIFSKGKCQSCASRSFKGLSSTSGLKQTPMKPGNRFSKQNKVKREGLGDFMVNQATYIKQNNIRCENCGIHLRGHVGEVAHILSKSKNPEVMREQNNIVYLCFSLTDPMNTNRCHERFDYSLQRRESMPVFEIARKRIEKIKEKVLVMSEEFLSLYQQ